MKILYLGCHQVLRRDEVSLFRGMGHTVWSPDMRFQEDPHQADLDPGQPLDEPDVVIFTADAMLSAPNVKVALSYMDRCPVVWRTIGQSVYFTEHRMKPFRQAGLKIVRYSPNERFIPGYIGEDALIRLYRNPAVWYGWRGRLPHILRVCSNVAKRQAECADAIWRSATHLLPTATLGRGNDYDWPEEAMPDAYREARVYFHGGLVPASYTLSFIEAWMTGTPIVALHRDLLRGRSWPDHEMLDEVPDLIEHEKTGYTAKTEKQARHYMLLALSNQPWHKRMSDAAREQAVRLFGQATIQAQWRRFLDH